MLRSYGILSALTKPVGIKVLKLKYANNGDIPIKHSKTLTTIQYTLILTE